MRNESIKSKAWYLQAKVYTKMGANLRKGEMEKFLHVFMVYDLESQLNHLLLEMAKLLNKQKAKPKAKDNTIVYQKSQAPKQPNK